MQKEKNKKAIVDEGYKVPENYFKEHKLDVMSKVVKSDGPRLKVSYNNILIKAGLIAASFLLLITLVPNKEQTLGVEDFIGYVESTGIDTWDEEIIIDAINLENIKNESSEELINYLEDTDLETILETI